MVALFPQTDRNVKKMTMGLFLWDLFCDWKMDVNMKQKMSQCRVTDVIRGRERLKSVRCLILPLRTPNNPI